MTLLSFFPPSRPGNAGSMWLSRSPHLVSDIRDDEADAGKSTATTVEQTVVHFTRYVVRKLVRLDAASSDQQFDNLYRTVSVVFTEYKPQLDRFVDALNVTDMETTVRSFSSVLERLADDGQQINGGRVVAVLAFAGRLAQHCIEKEIVSSDDVDQLADMMGRKIASWFIDGRHNLVRHTAIPS